MSHSKNNRTQRLITGFLGVALVIAGIVWKSWTFAIVLSVINIFMLSEFYLLMKSRGYTPMNIVGLIYGQGLFLFMFLNQSGLVQWSYIWLIPAFVLIFPFQLYREDIPNPFDAIAHTFLGIVYVSAPLALINLIVFTPDGSYHYVPMLGMLVLIWANDTTAYYIGGKFGRTKLFERISPNKSWEGALAGVFAASVISFIYWKYFTEYDPLLWIIFSLVTIIACNYGDLVESMLKRSLKVKDSGKMLPGHGGFLDRFDGLLLAAPLIVFILKLFH